MTIRYYRDNLTKDFIALNHFKAAQNPEGLMPVLAPSRRGDPTSMVVATITKGYLRDNCTFVLKMHIPDEWYPWLNLNQNPLTI